MWGEDLDSSRDVLELDSSTSSKFSRHLIIHVPGCALRCNSVAGNLLQHCIDANPGRFDVRKEPSSDIVTSFVDMSVYSRSVACIVSDQPTGLVRATEILTGIATNRILCV